MKKTIGVLFLSLLIAMPLAAGAQQEVKAEGPIELTFWHLWGGTRGPLLEDLVNKFKAEYPNVDFEMTFTVPNDLQKKVVQAAGTGTLPDIFSMHTGWYVNLLPEETLLNLDSHLKRDGIVIEDVLVAAEAKRSYWEDGIVYSLPNVTAGAQGLFFYNKGLMHKSGLDPVKDAPKNWNEFINISKVLVDKLNGSNRLDVISWNPFQISGQPAIITFSYGAGHPTVSDDGKTSKLNTPGVIETVKKFDEAIEEVYGSYGGHRGLLEWSSRVAGADTGSGQVQAFITEGQVFYIAGSWTIGQVRSGNPDMEFSILPVPGFGGQHGGIAKHGWSYAIDKKCKNKDIAWEFLKFLTIDPAGNGEFCKAQRRPCPISEVNYDPVYKEVGDMWDNLVISMNKDIVPASDIYMDVVKPWLRDIPARRIAGESIEDIMNSIHKQFQDYLDDVYE